jgi:hypothetical protein
MNDVVINRDKGREVNIRSEPDNPFSSVNIERDTHDDNTSELGLEFIMNKDAIDLANKVSEDEKVDSESDVENSSDVFRNFDKEDEEYPRMNHEEIEREKGVYLSKLNRLLSNPSVQGRRMNTTHSLQEIKSEVFRIQKDVEINNGINYSKQGLMFCINTIEMLSKTYVTDSLNGWSNVIMTDVNNNTYDQVLEELYEKYSSKISMGPEIKLISMIAGSAFMFSLQKSLVDKSLNNPGFLESILGKFKSKGAETASPIVNPENMSGPSFNVDDIDDVSSVSSIEITPPKKKRAYTKRKS